MGKIKGMIVHKDEKGVLKNIRIGFGKSYFVELEENNGQLNFMLGVDQRGVRMNAEEGELDDLISDWMDRRPDNIIHQINRPSKVFQKSA
jgi:hypothetical protein